MDYVKLRSRRDPAFWLPLLLSVVVLAPLVYGTYAWLTSWLEHLEALASSNPEAAQDEAIRILRFCAWSLCAVIVGFCAYLFRYFQLGRREGRLPPSGWWSLGAFRAIVGRKARRMSKFGLVLSGVLLASAIGLALAVEHLIRLIEGGLLAA
jgi:hypothetical protein